MGSFQGPAHLPQGSCIPSPQATLMLRLPLVAFTPVSGQSAIGAGRVIRARIPTALPADDVIDVAEVGRIDAGGSHPVLVRASG